MLYITDCQSVGDIFVLPFGGDFGGDWGSHFDKVDKKTTVSTSRLTHFDAHKKNAYRPDMKTYTFKVSRHDSHKKVVAKVENVKGVKEAKWNPRTREVTVVYDANVTSVRNIKHFMA